MLGHNGFRRFWKHGLWKHGLWKHSLWRHRRRGLLVVVGTVLALTGIAIALVPSPSSQAATGRRWSMGVQHVGYLTTNTGKCTVTVVSQWLAITAKHCGWVNASLKLNVAATSTPGVVPIKKIEVNRDLDVEAIFLEHPTGLEVTRVRRYVTRSDRLSFWGYGDDHSNNETNWLTRAEFDPPTTCPADLRPDQGSLCWHTTATHSVCHGDSGGPVLQNGTIVGMLVSVQATPPARPDGSIDCSRVVLGQAIKVQEMRTWLDQMIKDAERAS